MSTKRSEIRHTYRVPYKEDVEPDHYTIGGRNYAVIRVVEHLPGGKTEVRIEDSGGKGGEVKLTGHETRELKRILNKYDLEEVDDG